MPLSSEISAKPKTVREFLNPNFRSKSIQEVFSELHIFSDLSAFEQNIVSHYEQKHVYPAKTFADLAKEFHTEANTLTDSVQNALERVTANAPLIRIFHQPNTLMGLNILGQVAIASHLSKSVFREHQKPVVLFVVLDYDAADDNRFRSPQIPHFSGESLASLHGVIPRKIRKRIALAIPAPPVSVYSSWMPTLASSALRWEGAMRECGYVTNGKNEINERSAILFTKQHEIFNNHKESLVKANMVFMSWLVNIIWNLDVLFVSASSLLRYSHNEFLKILATEDEQVELANQRISDLYERMGLMLDFDTINFKKRGAWRICPSCLQRKPVILSHMSSQGMVGDWFCEHCGTSLSESFNDYETIKTPFGDVPKLIPRVTVCDLLEAVSYKFQIGLHYAGSIEHLLLSKIAGSVVTETIPIVNDFVWEPSGLFGELSVEKMQLYLRGELTTKLIKDWLWNLNRAKFPAVFYWLLFEHFDYIAKEILGSVINPCES